MEFSAICLSAYGQSPLQVWSSGKVLPKKLATSTIPCIHALEWSSSVAMCWIFIKTILSFGRYIGWLFQVSTFTHQTSLRELTTLGIKNAETLAVPSVRNDVSTKSTGNLFRLLAYRMSKNHLWRICWMFRSFPYSFLCLVSLETVFCKATTLHIFILFICI